MKKNKYTQWIHRVWGKVERESKTELHCKRQEFELRRSYNQGCYVTLAYLYRKAKKMYGLPPEEWCRQMYYILETMTQVYEQRLKDHDEIAKETRRDTTE